MATKRKTPNERTHRTCWVIQVCLLSPALSMKGPLITECWVPRRRDLKRKVPIRRSAPLVPVVEKLKPGVVQGWHPSVLRRNAFCTEDAAWRALLRRQERHVSDARVLLTDERVLLRRLTLARKKRLGEILKQARRRSTR
jgi:hypothetical protein